MPEQRGLDKLGGTMRLGAYPVHIKPNTLARKLYGREIVYERHRHRWEVNPDYVEKFEEAGLVFSGIAGDDERRMEILELPGHSYFIATQFHPEFKSRPMSQLQSSGGSWRRQRKRSTEAKSQFRDLKSPPRLF